MRRLILKGIEGLANSNFYFARLYHNYCLHRSSQKHKGPPLVIYTMGKVGSITIKNSLEASKTDSPVYHVHHLTKEYIAKRVKRTKKYFNTELSRLPYFDPKTVCKLLYLRKRLEKGFQGNKWKIITLTREPIGRNISNFFEHLREIETVNGGQLYKIKSVYYDFEITVKLDEIDILNKLFIEKNDHDEPMTFFYDELKSVFEIDVFASEFPKSKGYKIYHGEKADVLLIRLENLNECVTKAFKEFLHIERFNLKHSNIGREKIYAPFLRKFKESILLPDTYIDNMYGSKYTRHFYSEKEIETFKKRWSKTAKS